MKGIDASSGEDVLHSCAGMRGICSQQLLCYQQAGWCRDGDSTSQTHVRSSYAFLRNEWRKCFHGLALPSRSRRDLTEDTHCSCRVRSSYANLTRRVKEDKIVNSTRLSYRPYYYIIFPTVQIKDEHTRVRRNALSNPTTHQQPTRNQTLIL